MASAVWASRTMLGLEVSRAAQILSPPENNTYTLTYTTTGTFHQTLECIKYVNDRPVCFIIDIGFFYIGIGTRCISIFGNIWCQLDTGPMFTSTGPVSSRRHMFATLCQL